MNHIDRLLIQARKAFTPLVRNAFCIIAHDALAGVWQAVPQLWDGVPGSGFTPIPEEWKNEFSTADEATEAVNNLFESLNISDPERLVIIVDDVETLGD